MADEVEVRVQAVIGPRSKASLPADGASARGRGRALRLHFILLVMDRDIVHVINFNVDRLLNLDVLEIVV